MRRRLVLVIALGAAIAAWAWWTHPGDPVAALAPRRSRLVKLRRETAPELGRRVERWSMVDAAGDTVTALWRPAPPARRRTRPPWTVVMLGGIGTGERAALLIPEDVPANALAVDWPWRGPRRMDPWTLMRSLPLLRSALFETPACLALGLDAVARDTHVDTTRIALLGASLGVPPSIAALRLSRAPDALVLVDGFADLGAALRHGLAREARPRWIAGPCAALGARLLDPLEPTHHAAALDLPALVLNATHDERLPRESVERLHALMPHATVRWRDDTHVLPERRALIADLSREAAGWLDSLPRR